MTVLCDSKKQLDSMEYMSVIAVHDGSGCNDGIKCIDGIKRNDGGKRNDGIKRKAPPV